MAVIEENVDKFYKDEDRELYDHNPNKSTYISSDSNPKKQSNEVPYHELDFLHDIPLKVIARFGKSKMTIRQIFGLTAGSICVFDKNVGDSIDIIIGGKIMARGEIVIVNERFGVRISEITRPE